MIKGQQAAEHKSNFAEALEGRERHIDVIDLGQFFQGLKTTRLGFRRPTKGEQDRAADKAHEYVKSVASSPEARADHDLLADAKAAAAAQIWCREVAPKMDGGRVALDECGQEIWEPTGSAAFMSLGWMCEKLEPEEIAVLVQAANAVRARRAPAPVSLEDDTVEAYVERCQKASETDIPEIVLAGCSWEYLAQLVVLLSVKLAGARAEMEGLRAEIADRDVKLENASAPSPTGRACRACGIPEMDAMPRISPCNGDALIAHDWVIAEQSTPASPWASSTGPA